MDYSMWNDQDKFSKWFFRLFVLFLIIAGPGCTTFFLYLLKNGSLTQFVARWL